MKNIIACLLLICCSFGSMAQVDSTRKNDDADQQRKKTKEADWQKNKHRSDTAYNRNEPVYKNDSLKVRNPTPARKERTSPQDSTAIPRQ